MIKNSNQSFCPLYREAIDAAPWTQPSGAHTGLLFDKFASAWRKKIDGEDAGAPSIKLEFDKGVGQKKEGANEWINAFRREVGDEQQLGEHRQRQRKLIESLGGKIALVKNVDRFVTGMGREHPLENGFAWHPVLGVPYLPGSSLKGALRAWLREKNGGDEDENIHLLFGRQSSVGMITVFDMLPVDPPMLDVDVMTPHYGPYYQDRETPGDWHNPVPITFLTAAREQSWQVGVTMLNPSKSTIKISIDELLNELLEALQIAGAGAKTAIGYGRFERDPAAEERVRQEIEKRRLAREAEQKKVADKAAYEKSLAGASVPLQLLMKRQREEGWKQESGDNKMISGLTAFVEQNSEMPADCIQWIREWLESIPNYAGVWDQPDLMTGKKKDKPKYSSKAIRELVKRISSMQK